MPAKSENTQVLPVFESILQGSINQKHEHVILGLLIIDTVKAKYRVIRNEVILKEPLTKL